MIYEIIFKSWYKILTPLFNEEFNELFKKLNVRYSTISNYKIYPIHKKNIFKCFNTEYNDLKLIFMGSNPFDDYSEGLAFDTNNKKIRLHPITELLRYNIENTFYDGFKLDFDNTLEYLMKQGVLLLNESLTIDENKNNNIIWFNFIKNVLLKIQEYNTDLIFYICEDSPFIEFIDTNTQYLLTYKNPINFINKPKEWDLNLKQVNDILEKNNGVKFKINF